VRNIRTLRFKRPSREIKRSRSEIGDVAQHSEGVAAIRIENVSAHSNAKKDQRPYCQKAAERSAPHFLQRMAEPWNKPSRHSNGNGQSFVPLLMHRSCCEIRLGRYWVRCYARRCFFSHFSSYFLVG
jgi:hypothetical protein